MTSKEYLVAAALGFFSIFGWLLLFINIGTLILTQDTILVIDFFNNFNVIYIFIISTVILFISLVFMIYLFKYAGAENEIKEAKKRGEYDKK